MSPIPKEWGEPEQEEYIAQITDLREELDTFENDEGEEEEVQRIYIDLDDVDPDVLSRFPIRFRASKHRRASWMKWLKTIETLGFKCHDDPNDLIGNFVHIRVEEVGDEINGAYTTWDFPRPVGLFTSEEAAKEVFETIPKVAPTAPDIDLDTHGDIVDLWNSLKTLKNAELTFKAAVLDILPEGLSADEALALAKTDVG